MDRFYRFAGIVVRVRAPEDQMYREDGILTPFAVMPQQPDYTVEAEMVDRLDAPEGECVYRSNAICIFDSPDGQIRYEGAVQNTLDSAYLRILRRGTWEHAQILREPGFDRMTPKSVLKILEAEHLLAQNHGVLLHASYISREGRAVLFTAPSGTGKSTQAELWHRLRGARQINGDRAAVMFRSGRAEAAGIPFSGSSGICENVTLPLTAIVYLSQAPETKLTRLTGVRAFRRIWEGCCVNIWNREDVAACTQTVMDILATVPVFHLACTPDESAVLALERALEEMERTE